MEFLEKIFEFISTGDSFHLEEGFIFIAISLAVFLYAIVGLSSMIKEEWAKSNKPANKKPSGFTIKLEKKRAAELEELVLEHKATEKVYGQLALAGVSSAQIAELEEDELDDDDDIDAADSWNEENPSANKEKIEREEDNLAARIYEEKIQLDIFEEQQQSFQELMNSWQTTNIYEEQDLGLPSIVDAIDDLDDPLDFHDTLTEMMQTDDEY